MDDHANGVHDYLKYLKFGYGRCTDHTAEEIRNGRMTREQGIDLIREYDSVRPHTLDGYLNFIGMTEPEFEALVDDQRDESVWERDGKGKWHRKYSICANDNVSHNMLESARLPLVPEEERTFSHKNRHYYYSDIYEPHPDVDDQYLTDGDGRDFVVL